MSKRLLLPALLLVATSTMTACAGAVTGTPEAAPQAAPVAPATPDPTGPSSTPAPTTSTTPPPTITASACVQRQMATLSPQARVGQLFLLGVPSTGLTGPDAAALTGASAPGGVFLNGRLKTGRAGAAKSVTSIRAVATPADHGIGPYIAVDQEGGQIQVLSGPGIATMPPATEQGTWDPAKLLAAATQWGQDLRAAGVNVDLAPVSDVVPADIGAANIAIGKTQRSFGADPATVAAHVPAFVRGLTAAGVVATVKHFPGLGRVLGDTDFSAGVTDDQTTTTDPDLQPFQAGVAAGAGWLMISSAVYTKIDPTRPAAFSPTVVSTLVRGQLGFTGVVVSDEIGNAKQVAAIPPGTRAIDFIAAGGDIVLTANPATLPTMANAVLAQAQQDPQFGTVVSTAETRVLNEKIAMGLLHC